MIAGTVILEDTTIIFTTKLVVGMPTVLEVEKNMVVDFSVTDGFTGKQESFTNIPHSLFFKALAIAVHPAGEPDAKVDYPDAESIMGEIRWLP